MIYLMVNHDLLSTIRKNIKDSKVCFLALLSLIQSEIRQNSEKKDGGHHYKKKRLHITIVRYLTMQTHGYILNHPQASFYLQLTMQAKGNMRFHQVMMMK